MEADEAGPDTAFITVDGVIEGLASTSIGTGRTPGRCGSRTRRTVGSTGNQVFSADAFLLGRKTYQIWAAFWPTATGDEELANRMNEIPKYVVSNTLTRATGPTPPSSAATSSPRSPTQRERPGGDLLVYGSPDLVDTLLVNDLIDEFRLLFYPVILGSGKHLFRDVYETHHLRLVESRTFSSGVVLLTYQPESEAPTSRFVEDYSGPRSRCAPCMPPKTWTDPGHGAVHRPGRLDGAAAAHGDRAWRQLLDRHDHTSLHEVERWIGHYVKSTGDGMLATFDAPTRALRCAFELREAVARMGLQVRAAIHTGEVERRHDDVGGIGVHIAARSSAAGPDQVVYAHRARPGHRDRPSVRPSSARSVCGVSRSMGPLRGVALLGDRGTGGTRCCGVGQTRAIR